jgi:putative ABC transport system substrate-binding protein
VNRREFLGGALGTLCVPSVVVAQADRTRRIGWLDFSSSAENLGIFEQAMAGRGWTKGKAFSLDYRGGEGKIERLAAVTTELIRLPVDVIVAPGTPEALAARNATKTVPIVMAGVDDPVARGLVASLARPGRNITGVASARRELSGKLLSLVRELAPGSTRVAVLWDSTDPDHRVILGDLRAAAQTINVSLDAVEVQRYTDVEPAFAAIKRQGSKILVVPSSSMLVPRWIADLALAHGLALASTSPGYAYEGGLMAYTDDWNAVFERVAMFVDKVLKGAKPEDLPVELPAKFKLIVNAKTARALKLTIPQSIVLRADAVIE